MTPVRTPGDDGMAMVFDTPMSGRTCNDFARFPEASQGTRGRTTSWVVSAALALGLAFGCSKDPKPAAEQPAALTTVEEPSTAVKNTPEPPAPAVASADPNAAAVSKVSEESFELELKPSGAYKAGEASSFEIVLNAKGPYKVNDEYPYKFQAAQSPGVKYESEVTGKDSVTMEKKKAVMKVNFTPEAAGKARVAGQFKFSVCTDDRCLIEKRDLSSDLEVE
jgi:hypothetical protein